MAQCYPEQLAGQLAKNLAPVYFIYGDETLIQMECADAVRAQARTKGFTERQVFNVDKNFNWNQLAQESASLSLFAEKKLMELRIPTGKPGRDGSNALCEFVEKVPEDTLLLIISSKVEASAKNTKWFKSLNTAGVAVPVYPIENDRLPSWIKQRFIQKGMSANKDALLLLAQRTEGNLLACLQEIEKLFLLHGQVEINADTIEAAVAENTRYTTFVLVDAACLGDMSRCQRILAGLKGESIAPTFVLWALSREIHSLSHMAMDLKKDSLAVVLNNWRVWDRRKPIVSSALNRLSTRQLLDLISLCSRIDRVVKGRSAGNPWDELLQLLMRMTGVGRLPASLE